MAQSKQKHAPYDSVKAERARRQARLEIESAAEHFITAAQQHLHAAELDDGHDEAIGDLALAAAAVTRATDAFVSARSLA